MYKIKFEIFDKSEFVEINIEKLSTVFGITFIAISEKCEKLNGTDFLINPFNGEKIKVVVGNYFQEEIRAGIPAHNEKDFKFAKENNLEVKQVIAPSYGEKKENAIDVPGITAILFDPKTQKYGLIQDSDRKGKGYILISGGRDEGEDVDLCLRREILEETGYFDIKKTIKITDKLFSHYYHPKKKNYFNGIVDTFLVVLNSQEEREKN